MTFTRLGIAMLLVLLTGCSMTTSQPQDGAEHNPKAGSQVAVVMPELSPYEANLPSVSRKAESLYAEAVSAISNGDWDRAELILQEMSIDYPELSGPWVSLGIVYRDTDRPEQAIEAMSHAVKINKHNVAAWNLLAYTHRTQGNFKEAEQAYQKAIKAWPESAESHLNLAILYDMYMGRFAEAATHYERYQSLQDEPDRKVAGWLADLKRRKQVIASAGGGS